NPTEGDKPEVSIAATAPKAIEGIDNTLVFEITQDNVSEFDTTVDVKLGADSTIEAEDIASISYTKADGTQVTLGDQAAIEAFLTNGDSIKIPAGETAAPAIIVTVVDDDIYEVSEDMVLEIGNPENATIGTPSATGVILDENNGDDDKPTITVEDAEIVEGSSLVHTVTLDKATDAPVSYDLVLEDGTAVVGEDYDNTLTFSNGVTYDATTGQITIPAGVTEFTVTYPTISDNEIEYDETTKLTIGDSTATGTILDDDVPALVINDIAITETDEDQVVQFTVSIEDTTRLPLEAITVDVEIEHVSTVSGDVSTTVTQVTIPAGSTSATVDVTVVGDDFWEPTETYNVKLSNPKNATISDDTGVGTIINDDITAVNDVGTAVEGGGNDNTDGSKDATGNVLDNDDPTNVNATVTGIRTGANEGSGTVGKVGTSLHGTYGTLTLNSDGSYTYEVDDENTTVQRLQEGEKLLESFNYTMSDGTLEDIAVLDITIQGNNDAPQILEITSTRVSEEGLTAETSADNGIKDNFSFNETDQIFRDAVDNEISDEKEALETAKSNLAENPNNSDLLAAVTAAEEALEQARTVAEQKHIELKNDQTDSASDTRGMITFTDVDNFKASDFTIVPTGAEVTVQGNAVSWEWIDTADTPRTLKGTAEVNGNVVDVMTIEVGESVKNANGNYEAPYSVTLMHAIDHPSNNDEDVLELQFNTVVSDGIDGSIAKPISVFVEDDRPTVAEGKDTILLEPVTSNVQLIVDTSGSMGWSSGVRDSFFLFDQNGDLITLTSDEGAAIYNEGIDIYATNGSQLYTYGANNDLVHFQDGYNVSTGGQGKPPAGHIKATDPNYGYYYIDSANGAVSLQVGSNTQYDVSEGVWKVYYQGKELGRVVNQSEVKVAKYVTDFDDNKVGDTISIERGLSRMEVTQNAILDMIKAYEDIGSTKIQIIDFDIEGRTFKDSKWLTVQETMDILFDLEAGNATNYDSALATAIKNFDKPGAIDKADYNRTYFLTDGFPNRGQKGDSLFGSNNVEEAGGISPTEELEWKTWLSPDGEPNNPRQTSSVAPDGITAFAYAMGDPSNVNVDLIHPIAYDGVTGHDMDGQQADFSNLAQQLLNSIPAPTSEDRDLINGSSSDFIGGLGADGGGFVSITISGITYEYDQEANTVTAEDGSTVNYDPAKHLLTATSSLTGGIFYVHMDDGTAPDGTAYSKGQYSYQTGSTVYGYKEPIYFNVKDADGDIVSSEQLIDVYRLKANNDSIITTQTGEVTIDYKTLMANDITRLSTEFNGATESVVGAIGTITDPNTVTVTLDNFKARFNYSISDGGFDSNAVVTITQVSGEQGIDAQGETFVIVRGDRTDNTIIGSDTTGTNIDYEVFYGRGDDDIIQGGGGVDKFFGGTGNDTFLVDLEDVEIDGGAGKDTIVFDSSVGAADVSEFISTTEISDIEVLDLFDGVNQTLTISDVTVERITDSNNTLFINAEKDDTIILEGFTESVNSNQAGYNMFESANATIYLDIDNVPTII
ncbi:VCBS domain-containing protein, partial [Psychrobacter phenylpyruvicus]